MFFYTMMTATMTNGTTTVTITITIATSTSTNNDTTTYTTPTTTTTTGQRTAAVVRRDIATNTKNRAQTTVKCCSGPFFYLFFYVHYPPIFLSCSIYTCT